MFVFFCFLVGICDSVGWVGGLNDTGDMIIYCRLYNACVVMSLACACASNALFIVGFFDLTQETHKQSFNHFIAFGSVERGPLGSPAGLNETESNEFCVCVKNT